MARRARNRSESNRFLKRQPPRTYALKERWRLMVEGEVQGVGFRSSCSRRATDLGLSGWVRNLSNGRVEVQAEGDPLAPPCGSSLSIVHSILKLAFGYGNTNDQVNNERNAEVLYDLGCGDGRVCLEAYWHFGRSFNNLQCIGVEIEEDLVVRFRELISRLPKYDSPSMNRIEEIDEEPVENVGLLNHSLQVHAIQGDLCEILEHLLRKMKNSREAGMVLSSNTLMDQNRSPSIEQSSLPIPTIITLYLLPEALTLIEPLLTEMMNIHKRLRVVCNTWGFKSIHPAQIIDAIDEETGMGTKLFLYTQSL